ncbi:hypothetical protein BH09MYX1_BH09MYX1_27120 [soil metagenome]
MTSAAKTELQVGRLSPEDAERFASMFRPAWELDDAPFASGSKLSAADMDALGGGGGVNVDVQAAQAAPHFPPAANNSVPEPNSVVIALDPEPVRPPPAPVVAAAVPQQARTQQAPPAPKSKKRPGATTPVPAAASAAAAVPTRRVASPPTALDSGEFAPPKKSNMGLIVGISLVAVLAIGGIIAKVSMSNDTPKSAPVSTEPTQTTEERHIPPPPPDTDPTAATTATATTTAVTTATATTTPTQTAAAITTTRPTATAIATATHTAAVATTAHPPSTATGTGKTNTGKGTGGIVRDTPF